MGFQANPLLTAFGCPTLWQRRLKEGMFKGLQKREGQLHCTWLQQPGQWISQACMALPCPQQCWVTSLCPSTPL